MTLSIDIGSSSIKAGILTAASTLIWYHYYPLPSYTENKDIHYAYHWINGFTALCQACPHRSHITHIAISGHGPSITALDENNTELITLLWHTRSYQNSSHSFYLDHLLTLLHHYKTYYTHTHTILCCPEFLAFYLCNNACTIIPHEHYAPYIWNHTECAQHGFDPHKLPPFIYSGECIGSISTHIAHRHNLPIDCRIIAVGLDYIAGLIGARITHPGLLHNRSGSSEGINLMINAPHANTVYHGIYVPHAFSYAYNFSRIFLNTGSLLSQLRTQLTPHDCYQKLYENIQEYMHYYYKHDSTAPFYTTEVKNGIWKLTIRDTINTISPHSTHAYQFIARYIYHVLLFYHKQITEMNTIEPIHTIIPQNGIFLAGGITAKNIALLKQNDFFLSIYRSAYSSGVRQLLQNIPIYIVMDYDVSLYGAAYSARQLLL